MGTPIRRKSPELFIALATVAASAAMFLTPMTAAWSWPPRANSEAPVVSVLAALAIGLGLVGSRFAARARTRVVAALVAAAAASEAIAVANWSRAELFSPMPGIVILGLALAIGGWLCRQRLLSIGAAVLLVITVGFAAWPGRTSVTVERQGLRATLSSHALGPGASVEGLTLVLASTDGAPLRSKVDTRWMTTTAAVEWGLPVVSQPFDDVSPFPDEMPRDPARFEGAAFVCIPKYVASVSVHAAVRLRPPKPLLSLRIPLHPPPHGALRTANGAAWMQVADIRWATSQNTLPPVRCLHVTLTYGNPGSSGYDTGDIRFQDDTGDSLEDDVVALQGTDAETRVDVEVLGISKHAKRVEIEVFSPDQVTAHTVDLDFGRVAPAP